MPTSNSGLQIKGVDELIKKLGKVEGPKVLVDPTKRGTARILAGMKPYPPQPAGSRYRRGQDPRSEDLGGRWTTRVTTSRSGVTGKVGNNASYAPWVQSHQFQARHMGYWQTDKEVIDEEQAAIVRDFQRAIDEALK